VLGKRKDSDLRIHNMFLRFPLTPHYLRPTSYDKKFTLCSMRHALFAMRGSVHLTPNALRLTLRGRVFTLCAMFTRRSLGVGRRLTLDA
jgi:hypothetical protein